MDKKPIIPVILGPTASSKTSIGIELSKLIDGEVISVDSRKIYKGLPVGTATPDGTWNNNRYIVETIVHHLIGHLPPDTIYGAGDFTEDAEKLIEDIQNRGKTPILVGGTGFYFKALRDGLPMLPNRNEKFRQKLTEEIEKKGLEYAFNKLKEADPAAARVIKPGDPHKIIRALEVTHLTGQPFSSWKEDTSRASPRSFAVLGLDFAKGVLDKRIEARSQQMLKKGMIEETEAVLKQGYAKNCPALSSFGYKEAVQVVEGTLSKSDFLACLIKGTKAYAKRQRTWFRNKVVPTWFECNETTKSAEIALKMKDFCNRLN